MAKPTDAIQPVKVLAQTITALEAAVLECLAKANIKAVHTVRTTTRRIEAQLTLLSLVGGFPPYEDEADKLRRLLKKLRRAAGSVRDKDVQQDLVAAEGEAVDGDGADEARKEARKLKRRLAKHRDAQAETLRKRLEGVRVRLPKRVKALLDALEPAEQTTIAEADLVAKIQQWYRAQTKPYFRAKMKDSDDPNRLHAVRKIAKVARYLAETAPDGAERAHKVAKQFEAIQESGGQWHDWMILSELAAGELSKRATLPQRFAVHASDALADFRKRLR
jgi:CHAD domain-containing protein